MKASEAIMRAIEAEGGRIAATQFDEWMGKLADFGLVKAVSKDDQNIYYWELTDTAIEHLKEKKKEK